MAAVKWALLLLLALALLAPAALAAGNDKDNSKDKEKEKEEKEKDKDKSPPPPPPHMQPPPPPTSKYPPPSPPVVPSPPPPVISSPPPPISKYPPPSPPVSPSPPPPLPASPPPPVVSSPPPPLPASPPPPVTSSPPPPVPASPPPPVPSSPPPPLPASPPPPVVSSPPPPLPASPPPPVITSSPPPPLVASPPPPVLSSPPPPSPESPPPPVIISSPPPPVPESPPPPVIITPVPNSPPPPVTSSPPPPVPVPPSPSSDVVYCKDTTAYPTCTAPTTCPKTCKHSCHMDCATCKPICDCHKPGAVCEDPRFIGGDGNTFYFHGRMNRDFCLLSDANLHINAHFIGSHVPGLKRDPTWVQAVAVQFSGHRLYVGARKTAVWDDEADRLAIFFDGELVDLPAVSNARWEAPSTPSLSVVRTKAANGVVLELAGVFKIRANAVPITKEDSRTHNYGLTAGDCLAHLDLAFKFYSLTDDVHGVLGQTYRSTYVNRLDVSAKMPVMGGEREFASSGLFATDCSVARYEHGSVVAAGVLASEDIAGVDCSTSLSGAGVVCRK